MLSRRTRYEPGDLPGERNSQWAAS
jgi:hypothetical protein